MNGVIDRASGIIKFFAGKDYSLINFVGAKNHGNCEFKYQDTLTIFPMSKQEFKMCKKISENNLNILFANFILFD